MATLAEILTVALHRERQIDIASRHAQNPETGACTVCSWWVWPCPQALAALKTLLWCARRTAEIQGEVEQRTVPVAELAAREQRALAAA